MGIFGNKHVQGITEYELKHKHVQSRLDSVFPSGRGSSKIKRAALHTALGLAGDRDSNMSSSQKHGVIQKEEFESAVSGLENGGVITSDEAAKLRKVAEEPLNN
jgi:fructose-1,6-bisphosphatase